MRDIIVFLKNIYNILRYLIDLLASYKRFTRILFVLILFYKTRLLRLNLIISSSSFDTSISSSLSIESTSLLSSSLSLASNVEFLKNSIKNINSFIEFFISEAFINKNKKKKKDKEKEKEKEEEKNKKIKDNKKKVNKNTRFR